jgi:hypothetical protein
MAAIGTWGVTVAAIYALVRRLAPGTLAPIAAASFVAMDLSFVFFHACARPYALMPLLIVTTLFGLVRIADRRFTSGLLLLAVGAGLTLHMSPITIVYVGSVLAVGTLLAYQAGAPRGAWGAYIAALIAIVPLAAAKTAGLFFSAFAGLFSVAVAPPTAAGMRSNGTFYSWTEGSSLFRNMFGGGFLYSMGFALLLGVALFLALVIGRRKGWLLTPTHPLLSERSLAVLFALVMINPIAKLVALATYGVPLLAPWYHVPEAVLLVFPAALLIGTIRSRSIGALTLLLGLPLYLCLMAIEIPAAAEGSRRFATEYRRPIFEYVRNSAAPDDVIVVVSVWPEARIWDSYEDPLRRSFLLADALLVPGFDVGRAIPAPLGEGETGAHFVDRVLALVTARSRIWFVNQVRYEAAWNPAIGWERNWAYRQLINLGFHEQHLSGLPAEFEGRLFVLAQAKTLAGTVAGGDNHE